MPIELSPAQIEYSIEGKTGRVAKLDIPLMRGSRVGGIVFRDDNRDGTRDANEPLPAQRRRDSERHNHHTDSEVRFSLNDLPPRATEETLQGDTTGNNRGEKRGENNGVK